ncbi:flagellar motor switch protein FliN [bacterium]|nr:flagellar motor switch protein FliN [bacterium]MBU1881020.1 flagellar motor switch protein FliN [bacterium]
MNANFTDQLTSLFEPNLEALSSTLSTALNRKVQVSLSEIRPTDIDELQKIYPGETVITNVSFSAGMADGMEFLLQKSTCALLADLMLMGEGDAKFSPEEHLDAISELIGQLSGVLCTYLSELKGDTVAVEPPSAALGSLDALTEKWISCFTTGFQLEIDGFDSKVITLQLTPETIDDLQALSQGAAEQMEDRPPPAVLDDEDDLMSSLGAMQQSPEVRPANFEELDGSGSVSNPQSIDALMELELPVIIELGRTSMFIRDILELNPGSIVELNKLSGEPVDLFINDKRFACGEVVVIDENFGIRITDLVKVEDRIRTLK